MSDACSVQIKPQTGLNCWEKHQDFQTYMHKEPLTDFKPPLVVTAILYTLSKKRRILKDIQVLCNENDQKKYIICEDT